MRPSVLLISVAVIITVGGAIGGYLGYEQPTRGEQSRTRHKSLVEETALCEKSLEIAASFFTYNKNEQMVQKILNTNQAYSQILDSDLREKAYDLGLNEVDYNILVSDARIRAEKALISQINGATDPAAKAYEMIKSCMSKPPVGSFN